MAPTSADIRKFLIELFNDEELTILCYDYFRDVHDDFALGMSKGQKIQQLIEYGEHHGATAKLLTAMSRERSEQYNACFGAAVEAVVPPVEPPHLGRDARRASISIESPIRLELLLVPAGEFLMGSDLKVDKEARDDEQPQHRLVLPEFYIGKVPVTNRQYAAFVKAAGQTVSSYWRNHQIPAHKHDHPVVNVKWDDAMTFCRWLSQTSGKPFRLPTEAEWEKAARGSDGRIYPWGNLAAHEKRCNFGTQIGATTPVNKYPLGVSPSGALDMAGNVWEWTGSLYKPYKYDATDGREDPKSRDIRALRGGSFGNGALYVRCAYRSRVIPTYRDGDVGFRVASPGF